MHIDRASLAQMIDHSLLKADVTVSELEQFASVCRQYGFKAACVNSAHTRLMVELLDGSGVLLAPTVGFPLGACATEVKAAEARFARGNGAGEVDMVINVGLLKSGRLDEARADIAAVAQAAGSLTLKVILENCYLTDDEKRTACRLAGEAGAQFVKTSTGFGSGGATAADVRLMREAIEGTGMRIKAAGGIRDAQAAIEMIRAGASRLGVSAGDKIIDEFRQQYPDGLPLQCD